MLFVFGKLHWQFSVRFTGYVYRPPLDRGSGLRAGVSSITATAYSALPPALLVMWVVAAGV